MKTYLENYFILALAALALNLPIVQQAKAASWTTNGLLHTAREFHTATLLSNGKVLVAGGRTGAGALGELAEVELFDLTTGMWTNTGSMTTARCLHTATLLPNGKVLVAGGMGIDYKALSSAELYDPVTGTWTNTGSGLPSRQSDQGGNSRCCAAMLKPHGR